MMGYAAQALVMEEDLVGVVKALGSIVSVPPEAQRVRDRLDEGGLVSSL